MNTIRFIAVSERFGEPKIKHIYCGATLSKKPASKFMPHSAVKASAASAPFLPAARRGPSERAPSLSLDIYFPEQLPIWDDSATFVDAAELLSEWQQQPSTSVSLGLLLLQNRVGIPGGT